MLLKLKNINLCVFGTIIAMIFCYSCRTVKGINVAYGQNRTKTDSEFTYYFKILDSAAAEVKNDTIVRCCIGPIAFMEEQTKIPASSPGGFAGKMYFTKKDLQRWHQWYSTKHKTKQ